MSPELATKLVGELRQVKDQINSAIWLVKEDCDAEEFQRYRRLLGQVMGDVFFVLEAILKEHPSLMPPEMRDDE